LASSGNIFIIYLTLKLIISSKKLKHNRIFTKILFSLIMGTLSYFYGKKSSDQELKLARMSPGAI
jgi:hypothetical protein